MIGIAEKAALKAGEILLEGFRKGEKGERKADGSFVTKYDKMVEDAVKEIIKEHYPGHAIIGEECGKAEGKSEYTWIIDPLDGTHNFMHGSPLFGVSIGIAKGKEVVAGAVYLPVLKQMFIAERGKGATLNGKPVKMPERELDESVAALGSWSIRKDVKKELARAERLIPHVFEVRISGCAVFDLTGLATGIFDIGIAQNVKVWDVAAGALIAEEAGALVTDFDGKGWDTESKTMLITNKKIHKRVMGLV